MPDDRQRPRSYHDRSPQGGHGPRSGGYVPRSGTPGPPPRSGFVGSRPGGPPRDAPVSVRIREGDREVEVHGSPGFCRQLLDDLPTLFARLRGEGGRASAVALPAPQPPSASPPAGPKPEAVSAAPVLDASSPRAADGRAALADESAAALDVAVMKVLQSTRKPITIAELRRRLPESVSGQAVRRALERATDRVVNVGGKPAAYRAR
jgi:hypothetical protein